MKLKLSVILILLIGAITSCEKEHAKPKTQAHLNKELLAFEADFSKSLNYSSNETIKLIGFKKIKIEEKELAEFNASYEKNKEDWKKIGNYFYDKENATLMAYFPVEGALVEKHNELVEATELGEVSLDHVHNNLITVVGRKQTENITGVAGNIIKDGIIYLEEKNKSIRHFGNVYVFDFGTKVIMSEHDHHLESGQKILKASCMSNHGGRRNCSTAFGIYKGRCTFNSGVCMDYNGWFTNCVNGKYSNFPGSDCDYALGRGHCWSEIM